jgi:hypothetical protein
MRRSVKSTRSLATSGTRTLVLLACVAGACRNGRAAGEAAPQASAAVASSVSASAAVAAAAPANAAVSSSAAAASAASALALEGDAGPDGKKLGNIWASKFTDQEVAATLARLRRLITAGHAQELAEMVRYPIPAMVNGEAKMLDGTRDFLRYEDEIVNARFTGAIEQASPSTVAVTPVGIALGVGEVWLGKTCVDEACTKWVVKIIGFNVVLPPGVKGHPVTQGP